MGNRLNRIVTSMPDQEAPADILSQEDLQKALKIKGFPGRILARAVYGALEIGKVNAIHRKYSAFSGPDFADRVLEEVGVTFDLPEEQLSRIPREGGFITVSNHHFGSIDGLILCSVIGRLRSDYKILTTFLLSLIPALKESFMPVDNLTKGGSARSVKGIRMALMHIEAEGGLGFFPAGEVATWQKESARTRKDAHVIEDKPWAENIIKMIRNAHFPVIPVYFEGTNSRFFHFLGRIHPRLRTVRLIHELFNKRGTCVPVRIGTPILPAEMEGYDLAGLGRLLRERCYALQASCTPGDGRSSGCNP